MIMLCLGGLLVACQDRELSCADGEGEGIRVEKQPARFYRDERFGGYALNHYIIGTIDASRTYVICNVPEGWSKREETTVIFSGMAQRLKEEDRPDVLIVGEDFFLVFLDDLAEIK
jgi:hypothetical protein